MANNKIISKFLCGLLFVLASAGHAAEYRPPVVSQQLLRAVNFSSAVDVDTGYHRQFTACDLGLSGVGLKDHFRGHSLKRRGVPDAQQYYLCSRDPSNVKAILKLADGGIYWHSKMALDVDGSWAAWNGVPGATDLKETTYKWPGVRDVSSRAAQIDPDRIPFVVMPTAGLRALTGSASGELGREFANKTSLRMGDMGVVVYRDKWTPVIIGDGGPFMRLGEGSSRVFEAIGQSRCRRWSAYGLACVGSGGGAYPYRNFGLATDVVFILYPGSRSSDISPQNALSRMCSFAKGKLGLTGGAVCP